jgi:hypothetical protein
VINALLPDGFAWNPKPDGYFDKLLDGLAEMQTDITSFLLGLAYTRNPEKTSILDDLEREFGLEPNSAMTEAQRRIRLKAVKSDRSGDGTAYMMEQRLRASGFDVYVHINDPATDPNNFIQTEFTVCCGFEDAVCGYSGAVCGASNGMLIVNGNMFFDTGVIPENQAYWPLIFFVGGQATRDQDGKIVTINNAYIPVSRSDEFLRLVVKYKPLHSWAGIVAKFV